MTLGGGGGGGCQRGVTHTFFSFETLFLMYLEGKRLVTKHDKASKVTFSLIHQKSAKKVSKNYLDAH